MKLRIEKMFLIFRNPIYNSTHLKTHCGFKAAGPACIYTGPPRHKTGRQQCLQEGENPQPTSSTCWYPCHHPWNRACRMAHGCPDQTGPSQNRGQHSHMQNQMQDCILGLTVTSGRSHQVGLRNPTRYLSRRSTLKPATGHNLLHTFILPASR